MVRFPVLLVRDFDKDVFVIGWYGVPDEIGLRWQTVFYGLGEGHDGTSLCVETRPRRYRSSDYGDVHRTRSETKKGLRLRTYETD